MRTEYVQIDWGQSKMPNGTHKHAPTLVGSKPIANMNVVDREGLGPWIIQYKHDHPTASIRSISDAILAEHEVFISFQSVGNYLRPFIDPETGALCPMDKLPNIPNKFNPAAIAGDIHTRLEESQMEDLSILENLAESEMMWFKDPGIPIPLKLKVAKELRETLKLKFEMGGIVKTPTTVNNNLSVDVGAMQQILEAKPESVNLLRELLYLANKTEPVNITPSVGESDDIGS